MPPARPGGASYAGRDTTQNPQNPQPVVLGEDFLLFSSPTEANRPILPKLAVATPRPPSYLHLQRRLSPFPSQENKIEAEERFQLKFISSHTERSTLISLLVRFRKDRCGQMRKNAHTSNLSRMRFLAITGHTMSIPSPENVGNTHMGSSALLK